MSNENNSLSVKDYSINAFQAILKGIPYIGASLEQFIFGPLNELRMKRIETTLSEIAEALKNKSVNPDLSNEDFINLLESVAPDMSRATNEDRRQRFRDLLLNAAALPPGNSNWEEAIIASRLLKEIEAAGLAIMAAISKCKVQHNLTLTSRPVSQVFEGEFNYENPGEPQHVLPYDWIVLEYWARHLREKRLIYYRSHDARGGFGGVALAPLGEFLVRWTVAS